ncbi:MAG: hypothetical protein ACI32N_07070 [Bulleidia sp.]
MEFIVEVFMELLFEGIQEAGENEHVPYYLRVFFRFLFGMIVGGALCLMAICGCSLIREGNPAGILMILITLGLTTAFILKYCRGKVRI